MKKRSQDTYDASKLSSSFSCKSVVSVFLSPGRKSYVILFSRHKTIMRTEATSVESQERRISLQLHSKRDEEKRLLPVLVLVPRTVVAVVARNVTFTGRQSTPGKGHSLGSVAFCFQLQRIRKENQRYSHGETHRFIVDCVQSCVYPRFEGTIDTVSITSH